MDEKFTPTHRKYGGPMEQFIDELKGTDCGDFSYEQLRRMTEISLYKCADREESQGMINISFDIFEQLSEAHPQLAEDLHNAVTCLAFAISYHTSELSYSAIEREVVTVGALAAQNAAKARAMDRAKEIASELWAEDSEQAKKVSGMALEVKGRLVDEGYGDLLPESIERLREWVKPVAPEYARKGGRPSKS
jgi:hypothetical protein